MVYDRESRGAGSQQQAGAHDASAPGKRALTDELDPAAARPTLQLRDIAFPHAARIQTATQQAIPGRAVVDPAACEARGVPAFTDGDVAHFASESPELHVAAHEAAHLMQHAGATGDAELGAEGHAHQVAEAVVAGAPATPWLGRGASVAPALRHYTLISSGDQASSGHWKIGKDAKVGDEGRTVTPTEETHDAFADPTLIAESNRILKAKKSGVEIEPGGPGPSGPAPDGSGMKSTVKVKYKIVDDPKQNERYPHDCGQAARETMGQSGKDTAPRGIYQDDAGQRKLTSATKDPATFRDEIFVATGLGKTVAEARARYEAMSATDRDAYDKKHAINRYAAPNVGEAFTRRRSDHAITNWDDAGYNFHWGGVIMVAGGDRVTFENYVDPEENERKNTAWYFATYGPPTKQGQTWHEQWAPGVGGQEKLGVTMAAASSPDPAPYTNSAATMTTAALIARLAVATDAAEKMALESEAGGRNLLVTVEIAKAQEGTDSVYIKASAGKSYKSGKLSMKRGDKLTFHVPLRLVLPIKDKISVQVMEADVGPDDMISNLVYVAPFNQPSIDNRPWDDAEYHTTVKFER